jgi:uncharacterized integral membrane protein (TIGR00698 family)
MKSPSSSFLLPGIALCFVLAGAAFFAGIKVPVVGGAVFGILFGILFGRIKRPESFSAGIRFTGKKILQYAIILLGFEMELSNILKVGGQSLFVMLFTLSASFSVAAVLWRLLKIPTREAILIGVGTSICGGSAIAATAPVIKASDEEVAQSISTIFLFNIAAVFLFPSLGRLLGLSDQGFGVWAGTAVNDTSSVVAAASAWSQASGNGEALALATIVKLTRTLMIVPITLVLAFWTAGKERRADSLGSFSFAKVFPWFVLGFVATAALNSGLEIPREVSGGLAKLGKFMIVMAMSAIGLSTDLRKLLANGRKPLILGLCCWAAVAAVSLAVQRASGTL